jgi:hypothetical protein
MMMTDAERRAIERIVEAADRIADRIEEFREVTAGRKPIPAALLNNLRMARRHVRQTCDA